MTTDINVRTGQTGTRGVRKLRDNSSSSNSVKKIAIVGLPNTGKSQIFNNLTGKYSLVANYPLTTVEMNKTKCLIDGQTYEVIDTPGLHCLYIHSEEELIVRDMIFSEKPDIILQCFDANQLKQSLTLTADLLELGIPMVISLNAIDETAKKGIWIDSAGLSHTLGVPVIESIAINGLGTKDLKAAIGKARRGKSNLQYGKLIDDGISAISSELPENIPFKRKIAILLLLNDPFLSDYLTKEYGREKVTQLAEQVSRFKRQFAGHLGRAMNNKRKHWVNELAEKTTRKQKIAPGQFSAAFGRLSRHPVFGIPILLMVILIMYLLVVNVANAVAGLMEHALWVPVESKIDSLVTVQWLNDFLIGDYGVLSLGLANAFLTILPILTIFFIAFNILEDIGYIPNLCVLTRRIFDKIGLSGSAIMPLVLGFGCKTMATLATKSLRSKKEIYIAIYLIAFAIPCAAQMALNMSILGRMGVKAFAIAFSVLVFVEIAAGVVLNRILKEEERSDFLQELPAIRLPNPKAVIVKTYYRLWWFIKEAVPVFIYAAVILFVIDKAGILGAVKNLLSPVMNDFLGLPVQMVDALILCMARHEAAAGLIIKLIKEGQLNYIQCIVAVTITTMFVPCFANIMAMTKELGARRAITMAVIINASAFLIAASLNWVLVGLLGQ
ncbi:MAG: ferrous iron transport protein B [Planctomycetes bacterium]|nr:ferrous iron transport protein B [Planctomycetota bacterium]